MLRATFHLGAGAEVAHGIILCVGAMLGDRALAGKSEVCHWEACYGAWDLSVSRARPKPCQGQQ